MHEGLRTEHAHLAQSKRIGLTVVIPVYRNEDTLPELVDRYKSTLEEILTMEPNWMHQTEKDLVSPELFHLQWKGQKETLTRRIKSAIEFYDNMAAEASR